jgi:Radical SAM superfamily/Iron-sulfur cluster-binding domain
MLVNDPGRAREHISLLARRGCTAMAAVLNDTALERRWIDQATHQTFQAQIAALPQVTHQIFGIFLDSVITSLHFAPITDRALAREAFRQAVRWIEIETSSQCNRRCAYCPNSKFDRISHNDFLDVAVYEKMIRELTEIDYDGDIKFVGNNEFFMHPGNRRYVEYAHVHLPRARITLFSNGDYLKREDLEWASAQGVGQLIVTLHPGPTKHYDDLEVLRRINLFQTQTDMPLQLRYFKQGQGLNFVGAVGKTIVLAGLTDLEASGHNWTGLLPGGEGHVRSDPCTYPIRQFVVNYLGDIFMCCIAFKDRSPENQAMGAITGNLRGYESVFQAYTSPGLVAWRRSLFNNDVKADPCKTCSGHADYVEAGARLITDYASKHLAVPA